MDNNKAATSLTSRNDLASQLASFDSILALASEFNLSSSQPEHHTLVPPTLRPKSITTAQLIFDTEAIQEQLAEIERQLRTVHKLRLGGDIDVPSFDDRIQYLNEFINQLALLQKNRAQLVHKLSQPRVGDYILMDHAYHKDFVGLFQRIQEEIPRMQQNLDAMAWRDESLGSTRELDQVKTCLDELTELSQRQSEIADASQKLQTNLINVLQHYKKL
ncbi:hypothetical protein BC939DRAFT_435367 [Gamsiella multidivaricata]|uniref:uncharacterized protein n=1 Tax=Gamsiella multidivaricata TaxID=101098 RepID=UPI002220036E|nr:uncharacterized protein BC939DRAFT_435367 [Gamsiella multidivaricata]KAI7832393.1 hypothetical protein BC939DRAFT_435367 [Gamsiella multidivaricata]